MTYVLYNPKANNGNGLENVKKIEGFFEGEIKFIDSAEIKDMKAFLTEIDKTDKVVIAGGDGTLNAFVNNIDGFDVKNDVYLYATGTGNDFVKDLEEHAKDGLIKINEYIQNLPEVEVNGIKRKFINGVGYGIDGYCCEKGDEARAKGKKKVNYTAIAIKGALYAYKPSDAKITVDGEERTYKKVWIAPTMNGRYYGGGMNVAPMQDRLNEDKTLSLVVMHGSGRLKTLIVFSSIFKGEHIKHTEMVDILTGKEITVEFTKPTSLQIDGETVLNVTKYTARSNDKIKTVDIDKVEDDKLKI